MNNQYISIIGADPSISNFGLVFGLYDLKAKKFYPYECVVLHPDWDGSVVDGAKVRCDQYNPNKKKRKSIVYFEETKSLARKVEKFFRTHPADLVCLEVPSGGKGLYAIDKLFMASGMSCALLAEHKDTEVIPLTPSEVKKGACGENGGNACKERIMYWAFRRYPSIHWEVAPTKDLDGLEYDSPVGNQKAESFNEHIADCLACIHAGLKSRHFDAWLKRKEKTGFRIPDEYALKDFERVDRIDTQRPADCTLKFGKDSFNRRWGGNPLSAGKLWIVELDKKLPARKDPFEWDTSNLKALILAGKKGYTAEVIRKEFERYWKRSVLFSDSFLVKMCLSDYYPLLLERVGVGIEKKKRGRKPSKPRNSNGEHSYIRILKAIGLYDPESLSIPEIENLSNEKIKLGEIQKKKKEIYDFVCREIANFWDINEIRRRKKNIDSADDGRSQIDWRAFYFCEHFLLDSKLKDLETLSSLENQTKKKTEGKESDGAKEP